MSVKRLLERNVKTQNFQVFSTTNIHTILCAINFVLSLLVGWYSWLNIIFQKRKLILAFIYIPFLMEKHHYRGNYKLKKVFSNPNDSTILWTRWFNTVTKPGSNVCLTMFFQITSPLDQQQLVTCSPALGFIALQRREEFDWGVRPCRINLSLPWYVGLSLCIHKKQANKETNAAVKKRGLCDLYYKSSHSCRCHERNERLLRDECCNKPV